MITLHEASFMEVLDHESPSDVTSRIVKEYLEEFGLDEKRSSDDVLISFLKVK